MQYCCTLSLPFRQVPRALSIIKAKPILVQSAVEEVGHVRNELEHMAFSLLVSCCAMFLHLIRSSCVQYGALQTHISYLVVNKKKRRG